MYNYKSKLIQEIKYYVNLACTNTKTQHFGNFPTRMGKESNKRRNLACARTYTEEDESGETRVQIGAAAGNYLS